MSVRGVAIHGDQIGEHARLHLPDFHVQHAPGDRCGGLQRVDGGHAVVHHQLDFAGVFAVGEDADVAAAEDGDAGVERRLEAGSLARDAGGLGCFPLFQPAYCAVASPAASVGHSAT